MKSPGRFLVVATVLLLSLIWGTTWAAIRVGLDGVPPFTGVALRFARVRRYRPDKTPEEADTFETVQQIYRETTGLEPPRWRSGSDV